MPSYLIRFDALIHCEIFLQAPDEKACEKIFDARWAENGLDDPLLMRGTAMAQNYDIEEDT
jgi:hypothetical protein